MRDKAADAGGDRIGRTARGDAKTHARLHQQERRQHAGDADDQRGHDGRPVAVGDQVSFRFSVKNKGTAPAEQVVAMFDLPDEVEFVSAQGPGNLKYQKDGRVVLFDAMPIVPVNGELSYDVVVQAKSATPRNGDQRVLVKLYSTQLPSDRPLEQEQQLVIYADDDEVQPVQRVSGTR